MESLKRDELLCINGGITIQEYAEVVQWLEINNPDQLEVVLAMFDAGQIQFEV